MSLIFKYPKLCLSHWYPRVSHPKYAKRTMCSISKIKIHAEFPFSILKKTYSGFPTHVLFETMFHSFTSWHRDIDLKLWPLHSRWGQWIFSIFVMRKPRWRILHSLGDSAPCFCWGGVEWLVGWFQESFLFFCIFQLVFLGWGGWMFWDGRLRN